MRIEPEGNNVSSARKRVILATFGLLTSSVLIFFTGSAGSTVEQCKPGSRQQIFAAQQAVMTAERKVRVLQTELGNTRPGTARDKLEADEKQAETDFAAAKASLSKLRCVGTPSCVRAEPGQITLAKTIYDNKEAKAKDLEAQAKQARAEADAAKADYDSFSCATSSGGMP